jgi:hypothetical protein
MWARTKAGGKAIPLNHKPDAAGNVVLVPEGGGRRLAVVLGGDELGRQRDEGEVLWMPHHATCSEVARHR